jgi:hypothetical protein
MLDKARQLQGLGREKAVEALREWATSGQQEEVIILCRMLFRGKAGKALRRPMIGGAAFLGGTTYEDWPLEPITIFEGSPILIVTGYALGGHPEHAMQYLEYCLGEGEWVAEPYLEKSSQEIEAAVERFIQQKIWRTALNPIEIAFLKTQAK